MPGPDQELLAADPVRRHHVQAALHLFSIPVDPVMLVDCNLPRWDRLFGTYLAQALDGHNEMRIGLPQFRDRRWLRLDRMLLHPWANPDSDKV